MKEEIFVPLIVNGTRHQLGVTKKTTCSDVIKMATSDLKNYEICEIHAGNEKILPRNTKLLKQIRVWGINRLEYSLKLKMVTDKRKSKIAKLGRAKETLNRLKSMLKNSDTKINEKNYDDILNNLDKKSSTSKQYEKNVTVIQELNVNNVDIVKPMYKGKLELMNRYLRDIRVNDALIANVDAEKEIDEDCAEANNSETFDSDYLDDAFLTQPSFTRDDDLDDVNDDLNECLIYDPLNDPLDDDCNSSDENNNEDDENNESAFEDISDCSSVCEHDRNIAMEDLSTILLKMNDLKAAFSDGDLNQRITEDSLLNSFMNTVINDNESDEGLSSLDSDSE
ncbi:hypothetical protein ACF0H5_011469 [Mactra antiquata]